MSSDHVRTITIVGAGGTMGKYFADALVAQGQHTVNAITRPDSTSKLPAGLATVHRLAYNDHEGLVTALQGQDVLIITLSVTAGDVQRTLVDAAVAAGVPWIMPNEYGGDLYSDPAVTKETMIGERAVQLREYITSASAAGNGGKTRWVALMCGFWYEFSLAGSEARWGFDFDAKTLTLFGDGAEPQSVSTWPLCGEAVAKLFALPVHAAPGQISLSDFANKHVPVASFTVSQREMFASLLRVTGDKESDWTVTHEDVQERYARGKKMWLEKGDHTGYAILLYARMCYKGAGSYSDRLVNDALGLMKEDLDEHTKAAVELHLGGFFRKRYADTRGKVGAKTS